MEDKIKYISDLKNTIEEQKQVLEEHNKLLLECIEEKNRLMKENKHFERELFFLEHTNRVLKEQLVKNNIQVLNIDMHKGSKPFIEF